MNPDYSLRKSSPTPAQRGNVRKADAYREAFSRIERAMEDAFFLEAIAIEESIIADRLASYLRAVGCQVNDRRPSLERLLETWRGFEPNRSYELRRRTPHGLATERVYDDLAADVDAWRARIDDALHTFVAPPRDVPTPRVEQFLEKLRRDATAGRTLCDAVIGWHRKQVRPGRPGAAEEEGDEPEEHEAMPMNDGDAPSTPTDAHAPKETMSTRPPRPTGESMAARLEPSDGAQSDSHAPQSGFGPVSES